MLGRSDVDDVPITDSMTAALEAAPEATALVIGVAPAGGQLPEAWVSAIREAMRAGCDVVSGLHPFLSAGGVDGPRGRLRRPTVRRP